MTSTALQETRTKMVTCPTKYTPELLKKATHYIENYSEYGKNIPSVVRLAQVLDISSRTLEKWNVEGTKTEIIRILDKIRDCQHMELVENGLAGNYNSNIAKLVLGKHGYHDKQELTADIKTEEVGNNELARRLAFVLAKGVTIEGESE